MHTGGKRSHKTASAAQVQLQQLSTFISELPNDRVWSLGGKRVLLLDVTWNPFGDAMYADRRKFNTSYMAKEDGSVSLGRHLETNLKLHK